MGRRGCARWERRGSDGPDRVEWAILSRPVGVLHAATGEPGRTLDQPIGGIRPCRLTIPKRIPGTCVTALSIILS